MLHKRSGVTAPNPGNARCVRHGRQDEEGPSLQDHKTCVVLVDTGGWLWRPAPGRGESRSRVCDEGLEHSNVREAIEDHDPRVATEVHKTKQWSGTAGHQGSDPHHGISVVHTQEHAEFLWGNL